MGLYWRGSSVPLLPSPSAINAFPKRVAAFGWVAAANVPAVEVLPATSTVSVPSGFSILMAPVE